MIPRITVKSVEAALERQAAVALIGPRQVGKTTLALSLAQNRPSVYLDLENKEDRDKLIDPVLFLRQQEDKLVILDEIHRVPEIFQSLRGLIDQGRRMGNATGRFLILGSASMDLLKQSGESLAGRIEYVEMGTLNILEIEDLEAAMNSLWLRGGFPNSYLAKNDTDSFYFRRNFIRTYLERDIPQFGHRIPAETLERFWTMLAHNQGTVLNASRLAGALSVSAPTITNYVGLLVDLLLIRRLMPFHANVGKRLVKSPKIYIRDSGLVHALLGIEESNELAGHPVIGESWEGFVVEMLLEAAPNRTLASFYRTAAGAEMDLVLDLGGRNGIWAIEIKRSLSGKPTKGFYQAKEDIKPSRSFIVYSGQERYPLSDDIEVISVREMARELAAL